MGISFSVSNYGGYTMYRILSNWMTTPVTVVGASSFKLANTTIILFVTRNGAIVEAEASDVPELVANAQAYDKGASEAKDMSKKAFEALFA